MSSKVQYHKCAKPECNAKCSKEFCRQHIKKLNMCLYPGCDNNCRKVFCHYHNPETMKRATEYQRKLYFSKKAQIAN